MARVANYANFIKQSGKTPLSVEYFLFSEKDKFWDKSDKELINFAFQEMVIVGLLDKSDFDTLDGFVIREKNSYPAYHTGYKNAYETLKNYVQTFQNLQLVGRAGLHKYNNQDHALLTGVLAARNYMGEHHSIWDINSEDEYLEERRVF